MSATTPPETTTLPLLRGNSISLEDALDEDENILRRLDYPQQQKVFGAYLTSRKTDIEALVCFHLRVNSCQVADESDWLYGSYNVCISVSLPSDDRVLVRIPLPYKVGEIESPGNVNEKLRCEVATYIWIRQNCPTVSIPSLYGFGFPNGPVQVRSWLGLPTCPYVATSHRGALSTGYMIISFVTQGRMLSETFAEYLLDDQTRRLNLFNDLTKIILSLKQRQLPSIGSLTFEDDGSIHPKNRPLTLQIQSLENEGIPPIPRETTYQSIEPYLLDLLQCHDNRIHYQPNSIHNLKDGREQFAALTMMRGLLHQFVSRQYRNGPFVLTLTDLHPSNIFVDDNWHITSLIDLEWACSLPIEMQTAPYWLSGCAIDTTPQGPHLNRFTKFMTEYINAFTQQEAYFEAFGIFKPLTPKGLLRVFNQHIQRRFCEEHCTQSIFDRIVSPYWGIDAEGLI
ncbi:hypothetical protein BO71DRAFT_485105 [Aspergillus ellipticus CBS 707.79]|uniref:Uncharacterized protein n=1 Tax=Aspergillus ellipticus CBS 707.79 TaxID=1448320 RepID=A0A319D6A1_9EURO|nr:hypothetical protein BO71DRAFT_485105 [Aspergillus ellipticus CBS 707.79]